MTNTKTKKTNHYYRALAALVVLAVLASTLLATSATRPAYAADGKTFTVNRNGDFKDTNPGDGICDATTAEGVDCSLRAAIQEANAVSGADAINFNIPAALRDPDSGVATIAPRSQLPAITRQVTINGYSQPGASSNKRTVGDDASLKIELDGTNVSSLESGLEISDSSNSVIRGLVINRFAGSGINIHGDSAGNRIEGNFIGTDPTGTVDRGNIYSAVNIFGGASKTVIGGSTPDKRNVLSGNDAAGTFLTHANGSVIQGNYIGTDKSGTRDLGNVHGGVIIISGSAGNTIGGTTAASRNVISGNESSGLDINGSRGTRVLGNRIGTTVSGKGALGNATEGVFIVGGASDNLIGDGTTAGANTIAFNGRDGVSVFDSTSTGNEVSRNSIFSNAGLGIDLGGEGEDLATNFSNPNDSGDTDPGPNGLQNKPTITSAKTSSTGTTVAGTLNSVPNMTFVVSFYANPSGGDEGKRFLGKLSVNTDRNGNAPFTEKVLAKVSGNTVTATATSAAGDTSEFSTPRTVVSS